MIIDSRELPVRDGFQLTARKFYDEDSHPETDYDCYTPRQVAAWRNDEWNFVGLQVIAHIEGIELGEASLWSIEDGHFTCTAEDDTVTEVRDLDPLHDDDYLNDLIDEAIGLARANLQKINAAVTEHTVTSS